MKAISAANYLIRQALSEGDAMTHLKLQKVLYFAQGWALANWNGFPLFEDEIEAWPHGPVIPSIYQEFKLYGSRPIDELAWEAQGDRPDPDAERLIDEVWKNYRQFSALQLSEMTHESGTPWATVAESVGGTPRNQPIPKSLIQACFKQKLERAVGGSHSS